MFNLVRTEWLKIKNYRAFWLVMIITALTYPGINYMFLKLYYEVVEQESATGEIAKAVLGNPFSFPEVWRTVAFFSSLFVFIPAIVIIMLITNEYTYKTGRQNIIDGWSRDQFMFAKLTDVLLLSLMVTGIYAIVTVIMGVFNTTDYTGNRWELSYYIGLFALQTFAQLSFAFMIGFLVRKAFIALAIFAFYGIIFENILSKVLEYKVKTSLHKFLPLEISNRLMPRPAFLGKFNEKAYQEALKDVNIHILYTFIFLILLWTFCFWLNKRRDL
jgi:ABC-2 type transport system permease protein